ncbi:MAG: hypothetical protein ABIH42_08630, partial [Planctomycetota bacterium]
PISIIIFYIYPSSLTNESVHCYRLAKASSPKLSAFFSTLIFRIRSCLSATAVAFSFCFLLYFSEFEVASILGIKRWTVQLFDAQVGGIALKESVISTIPVLLCELIVLAITLIVLLRSKPHFEKQHSTVSPNKLRTFFSYAYLIIAFTIVSVIPALIAGHGAVKGITILLDKFVLLKEIIASILFAATSCCATYITVKWLYTRFAAKQKGSWLFLTLLLTITTISLLGALLISILILTLFQTTVLKIFYDSPLTLFSALCLLTVPFALLMQILFHGSRNTESLHLAELLKKSVNPVLKSQARRLIWQIRTRKQFLVIFLLFCIGYFDMTASSILAPSSMPLASARLYNLTHYGQSAVLSAMVFVTFTIPFLIALFIISFGSLFELIRFRKL